MKITRNKITLETATRCIGKLCKEYKGLTFPTIEVSERNFEDVVEFCGQSWIEDIIEKELRKFFMNAFINYLDTNTMKFDKRAYLDYVQGPWRILALQEVEDLIAHSEGKEKKKWISYLKELKKAIKAKSDKRAETKRKNEEWIEKKMKEYQNKK